MLAKLSAYYADGGAKPVEEISIKRALSMPLLLLGVMMIAAAGIATYSGVDATRVFKPYLRGWGTATLISVLIWALFETGRMARRREDDPTRKLLIGLKLRYPLLIIPGLIFPLFLGGYTWAKASIPFAVGYPWESFWADLDHVLLRADGWRIAHALVPAALAPAWTYFYAIVWGFALVFSGSLMTVFARPRLVATFYTALMLSWFVGGFVMAYALSAAGPVFVHLVDPALAERFSPLRAELLKLLGPDDIVLKTQRYLAAGIDSKIAVKASGISAMPSMHIATVTVISLAARGTRWMPLALLFWGMTFFGSVYLGYHYAVDAPVAAAVAALCWLAASRVYQMHDVSPGTVPRDIEPDLEPRSA